MHFFHRKAKNVCSSELQRRVLNKYQSDASGFTETVSIGNPTIKACSVKEPDIGDYIIFHATVRGTPAYRHTEEGSLLVQELCKAIKDYPEEDVLTLSTEVNRAISKREGIPDEDVQMCEVSHTLRKRFVLGPGHKDESDIS